MTSRTTAPARRRFSTRILLTLAAIGVAAGLVAIPAFALAAVVWVALPPAYGLLVVPYVLPGVIAQVLIPRGGSALITGLIGGLVAAPFTGGFGALGVFVFVAALQELPYLVTRWRRWGASMAYITATVVAAAYAAFWWFTLDAGAFPPLVRTLTVAVLLIGIFGGTALARAIASGLQRAGVGR